MLARSLAPFGIGKLAERTKGFWPCSMVEERALAKIFLAVDPLPFSTGEGASMVSNDERQCERREPFLHASSASVLVQVLVKLAGCQTCYFNAGERRRALAIWC